MSAFNLHELLIRIAKKHDKKAFEQLVQRYSMQMHTYAIVFIKNDHLAEEIVSDVWLKIWNNREKLDQVRSISNYLFIATKNQSLHYRNRMNQRSEKSLPKKESQLSSDLVDNFTPLRKLEQEELGAQIDKAIDELPEISKKAFRLVRQEGKSYQEAAEELKISVNTLKTHLRRAMKKLRSSLTRQCTDSISF